MLTFANAFFPTPCLPAAIPPSAPGHSQLGPADWSAELPTATTPCPGGGICRGSVIYP